MTTQSPSILAAIRLAETFRHRVSKETLAEARYRQVNGYAVTQEERLRRVPILMGALSDLRKQAVEAKLEPDRVYVKREGKLSGRQEAWRLEHLIGQYEKLLRSWGVSL